MRIRLVSFNIRCCDDPNGNSIAERAPRLRRAVMAREPDVICFQELRPAWEPYMEEYYVDYDVYYKYRNMTVDIEAAPIMWRRDRFECISHGHYWLSDTPDVESKGWDELYDCYRMCTYVTLLDRRDGKAFTVMNTHLGFGDTSQIKSIELIRERSLGISNLPKILTGDFNSTPDSVCYRRVTEYYVDVNAVTARDLSPTYHAYDPTVDKAEHIDYCFVTEDVKPISQAIITDTYDGGFPSDHYGLSVELEL